MSGQASLDFGTSGEPRIQQRDPRDAATPGIPGLTYLPRFLNAAEQQRTLEDIDRDESQWLHSLERRVQHYGWRYDYRLRTITADQRIGPLPDWCAALARRLFEETDAFDRVPDQAIVNEYEPGQGIAMHVDRHCFGGTVATISLGDAWRMDFRPSRAERSRTVQAALAAGSALILSGDARYRWLHGISKRKRDPDSRGGWRSRQRRVSVTFRTVELSRTA